MSHLLARIGGTVTTIEVDGGDHVPRGERLAVLVVDASGEDFPGGGGR